MSTAHKCDRCGELYEATPRTVCIDVNVLQSNCERESSWSDVDFCVECSKQLLDFIKPALNDFDEKDFAGKTQTKAGATGGIPERKPNG